MKNKILSRKENAILIVTLLFFILGFLTLTNPVITGLTVENLTLELNETLEIQGIGDQVINASFPLNESIVYSKNINFTYDVKDTDSNITECSLFLNIDDAGFVLNRTMYGNVWRLVSWLIMSNFGSDNSRGIATNGSDFWVADGADDFIYHLNSTFDNQSDGISYSLMTPNSGNIIMMGIALDSAKTGLWVVDYSKYFVYHVSLDGTTNYTDGFSVSGVTHHPQGITTNGSDFWISEFGQDDIFHLDANGNNLGDGFKTTNSFPGLTTNGSTLWRSYFNQLLHTTYTGSGLPGSFYLQAIHDLEYMNFGGNVEGLTTPQSAVLGGGEYIDFYMLEDLQNRLIHIQKNIKEGINQTFNLTFPTYGHTIEWKVGCYDNNEIQVNSSIKTLELIEPLKINLQAPNNNTALSSTTGSLDVSFTYNVTNAIGDIKNCTLLRNVYDGTGFSFKTHNTSAIQETINQSINLTFTESSTFDWKVSCYGDDNIQRNSTTYKLTLSISTEEGGIVSTPPLAPPPALPPPAPPAPQPPAPPTTEEQQEQTNEQLGQDVDELNIGPGFSGIIKDLLDIPLDMDPRLIHLGMLNNTLVINIGNETEIEITDTILIKGVSQGTRPDKPTIWLRLFLMILLILLLIVIYYLYKKHKPKKKIKLTEYPTEEIDVYKINYLINQFNTLTKQIKQNIADDNLDQAQTQYQELLRVYNYLIIKLSTDREKLYNNIKQLHNLLRDAIKINYYKKKLK